MRIDLIYLLKKYDDFRPPLAMNDSKKPESIGLPKIRTWYKPTISVAAIIEAAYVSAMPGLFYETTPLFAGNSLFLNSILISLFSVTS